MSEGSDRLGKKWSEVVLARAEELKARAGQALPQVPTGIAELDENGGLEIGILTVIAGHTGDGKSVFKLHLMEHAAKSGLKVLVLDFEDPAKKTADRSLASITGIPAYRLGRFSVDEEETARLDLAASRVSEWGKKVEHVAGLMTAQEVKQSLRRNTQAKLVLVDYAQALPAFRESLERVIADVAWELNLDAQRNERAVVLFSQVKRDVEERGNETFRRNGKITGYRPGPGKSDLQWSSALGDRAKALWYIFRPGRWGRKMGLAVKDDHIEIIVDKANFGRECTVKVPWNGELAKLG